ncbi:hypothetical protein [Streptomyces sp. NPDC058295]|uniref:Orn/Lys/Arg family decarboxylase n=1 Tax=Streptomyces sp. NPDC058295 TaxID=3346431 RepID=UPI0036EA9806
MTEAPGQVAAAMVTVTPPGIPVLMPGESIGAPRRRTPIPAPAPVTGAELSADVPVIDTSRRSRRASPSS